LRRLSVQDPLTSFIDHGQDVISKIRTYLARTRSTTSEVVRTASLWLCDTALHWLSIQYGIFKIAESGTHDGRWAALNSFVANYASELKLQAMPLPLLGDSYFSTGSFQYYRHLALRLEREYYVVSVDASDPPVFWPLLLHEISHCWLGSRNYVEVVCGAHPDEVSRMDRRVIESRIEEALCDILATRIIGPAYPFSSKLPFIPVEAELDSLIAGCGPKTSTFLQLLKETAVRAGEANQLPWTDIDFESATIRVTPEKRSEPRIFKISNKLLGMLSALRLRSQRKNVFAKDLRTIRKVYEKQRANIARKLQNPRLLQIHFHIFRHWKATMLYHQTKDILYVMKFLGHKNIKNTLLYIQLEEAMFKNECEEYICKAAKTVEEAKALIENGFEYVCDVDGAKLFRRRI